MQDASATQAHTTSFPPSLTLYWLRPPRRQRWRRQRRRRRPKPPTLSIALSFPATTAHGMQTRRPQHPCLVLHALQFFRTLPQPIDLTLQHFPVPPMFQTNIFTVCSLVILVRCMHCFTLCSLVTVVRVFHWFAFHWFVPDFAVHDLHQGCFLTATLFAVEKRQTMVIRPGQITVGLAKPFPPTKTRLCGHHSGGGGGRRCRGCCRGACQHFSHALGTARVADQDRAHARRAHRRPVELIKGCQTFRALPHHDPAATGQLCTAVKHKIGTVKIIGGRWVHGVCWILGASLGVGAFFGDFRCSFLGLFLRPVLAPFHAPFLVPFLVPFLNPLLAPFFLAFLSFLAVRVYATFKLAHFLGNPRRQQVRRRGFATNAPGAVHQYFLIFEQRRTLGVDVIFELGGGSERTVSMSIVNSQSSSNSPPTTVQQAPTVCLTWVKFRMFGCTAARPAASVKCPTACSQRLRTSKMTKLSSGRACSSTL